MQDNNKLTINNIEKLKGKAIGLYIIDEIRTNRGSYQIRGVKPPALTEQLEILLTTISRDVRYDERGEGVHHHRMLRAVLLSQSPFYEVKEFELPLRNMSEIGTWLNWMGAYENGDGWNEENL